MSQRGGSVLAHFTISGGDAPLIRRGAADALLALDRDEATRNLSFVRAGGAVFVNTAASLDASLNERPGELEITIHSIDADGCAAGLASRAATNIVMLGFAAAHRDFGVSLSELENAVRTLGPPAAVEPNLRALNAGARGAQGAI